jgi:hypothetical protein
MAINMRERYRDERASEEMPGPGPTSHLYLGPVFRKAVPAQPGKRFTSPHIDVSVPKNRLAMDERRLADVLTAVQGAQSAFQNLCGNHRLFNTHADSRDLQALDISLHALGNVVEMLDGVISGRAQIQLVDSILAAPALISASGDSTSLADVIIGDMHNLQTRLIAIQRNISPLNDQDSQTLVHQLPLGEAMSMRGMIDKYRSIISEVCSGQIMCVIASWRAGSVLKSSRATADAIQNSVHDAMMAITEMREEMKKSKLMDQTVIRRA